MKYIVTYGGWYQRTTLHLSEIYDLFSRAKGNTHFPQEELSAYHKKFQFTSVTREAGYLEFVKAVCANGIEVRYYEDGLYVLSIETAEDITKARDLLERYYSDVINPAVAYIFSRGAPTPKVLANIKTEHPVVVHVSEAKPKTFKPDQHIFGDVYSTISSEDIIVHKTPGYIFIVSKPAHEAVAMDLAEMQIFFREFKDQLEKYLNIHRNIWEEITEIKERKLLRGAEIESVRAKLDSYQKTVSLISNRINQMGSYIRTRSSIAKNAEIEEHLRTLFEFKFEVLTDTLDYIKEVWKMTSDYLASAIQNVVEIKNQSASKGIQSLQILTSIGAVSGLLAYFTKSEWPKFTLLGLFYFALIIGVTWLVNYSISTIFKNKKYNLKFSDTVKEV